MKWGKGEKLISGYLCGRKILSGFGEFVEKEMMMIDEQRNLKLPKGLETFESTKCGDW